MSLGLFGGGLAQGQPLRGQCMISFVVGMTGYCVLAVLVEHDGVAIWVFEDEVGGASGGFVGFGFEGEAMCFELFLDVTDIGK